MTLGQNRVLRYGHLSEFFEFFGDRMANWVRLTSNLVCILKFIFQNIWPKWPSIGTK